ncbi:hypothetical protein E2C01_055604 [Portunus trituberculatus]|uniref:Uncharacterized protein n=1 Tax=Portunus trituberculatus TaxID=210409 RepID=A0A5B7GN64_PORTR|nr:hypothetical protein [Portunus trituberculatus]
MGLPQPGDSIMGAGEGVELEQDTEKLLLCRYSHLRLEVITICLFHLQAECHAGNTGAQPPTTVTAT